MEDFTPPAGFRLVGRTNSIEEAERLASQYELQGFETRIVKRERGGIALYELWVGKKPEIFSGPRSLG